MYGEPKRLNVESSQYILRTARFLLSVLILIPLVVVTYSAHAAPVYYQCNNVNYDGGIYAIEAGVLMELRECTGDVVLSSDVTTLQYATEIGSNVTSISIPEETAVSSENFSVFRDGLNLTAITVDPDNANLKSVDGVLFNKSGSRLIYYPSNKSGNYYEVPQEVHTIDAYSFATLKNLTELEIGPDVISGLDGAFQGNSNSGTQLQSIVVHPSNATYSSVDGVLLSADGETLFYYPEKRLGTDYTVPSTVEVIAGKAFYLASNISNLTLPPKLRAIETYAFQQSSLSTLSPIPVSTFVGDFPFYGSQNLQEIIVDESDFVEDPSNPGYFLPPLVQDINGVLFSADGTKLIEYPDGKQGSTYEIPQGVEITSSQWTSNTFISRLVIPASVISYGGANLPNLRAVVINNAPTFATTYNNASSVFGSSPILVRYCGEGDPSSEVMSLLSQQFVTSVPCNEGLPAFIISNNAVTLMTGVAVDPENSYGISSEAGTQPRWYSISPDPTSLGLTFDSATGLLSGTPNSLASSQQFTITGSNTAGDSNESFTLEVVDTLPTFSIFPTSGDVGGGTIITATLPQGLTAENVVSISIGSESVVQLTGNTCGGATNQQYVWGAGVLTSHGFCANNSSGNQIYFVAPLSLTDGPTDLSVMTDLSADPLIFTDAFTYTMNPQGNTTCSNTLIGTNPLAEWDFEAIFEASLSPDLVGNSSCGNINLSLANATGAPSGTGLSLENDGLHFDGTNWLVSYGKVPASLVGNASFTITAWVTDSHGGIAAWGKPGLCGDSNNLDTIGNGTGGIYNYWWNCDLGTTEDLTGSHFIAVTSDGENSYIYLDGVLADSTYTGNELNNGRYANFLQGELQIGKTLNNIPQTGTIQKLSIYDSELSSQEVLALFSSSPPPTPCYVVVDGVLTDGSGCTGDVVIDSSVTQIGQRPDQYGAFQDSSITSVTIPATVTNIGYCAFCYANSLTSVTFEPSSNILQIGAVAFASTPSMKSLTIPSNVSYIFSTAFSGSGLKYLIFNGLAPEIGWYNAPGLLGLSDQTIGWVTQENESSFLSPQPLVLNNIRVLTGSLPPPSIFSPANNATLNAEVGLEFSQTMDFYKTGTFVTSVTSGELPDGIELDTSGHLTGTPTLDAAGITSNVTITLTDEVGETDVIINFDIATPTPPYIDTPGSDGVISRYAGFPIDIEISHFSRGSYTLSQTGLPAGLTIESRNYIPGSTVIRHYITGSTTNTGSHTVTLTLINEYGQEATSNPFTLEIKPAFADPVTLSATRDVMASPLNGSSVQYSDISTNAPRDFYIGVFAKDTADADSSFDLESFITVGSFLDNNSRLYSDGATNITVALRIFGSGDILPTIATANVATKTVRIFTPTFVACLGSGSFSLVDDSSVVVGNTDCDGGVEIPEGVTRIALEAFSEAWRITSVSIPSSVVTIETSAFSGLTNLTSLIIPDSVVSIGNEAFAYNSNLNALIIGDAVQTIGTNAFAGTTVLTTFEYCGPIVDFTGTGLEGKTKTCSRTVSTAPTIGTATAASTTTATVTFTTPTSNGGSTITSYRATSNPGSFTGTLAGATAAPITVAGLTPGTSYTFTVVAINAIGTSPTSAASNSITTPVAATAVPLIEPPLPIPFLKTITPPRIQLVNNKLICTAGTYKSGITLDGIVQGDRNALFTPAKFIFNLFVNRTLQTLLTKTTTTNSAQWDLTGIPSASTATCSVTVSEKLLTNTDKSTDNSDGVEAANLVMTQAINNANTAYALSQSENSKIYQKALVDNRTQWRADVEKVKAAYYAELSRISALPAAKTNSALGSAARKTYAESQKKVAADYKASGPAAQAVLDAVNKVALDAKNAAIAKANASYGTFIESIGYGVLIP